MSSRSVRIAVLASSNVDLLKRLLKDTLAKTGIDAELHFSGYGLWETESLDPRSPLYEFQPEVVIVFVDSTDLLPALHTGDMLPRWADVAAAGEAAWQRVETAINGLLTSLPQQTSLLVHNLAPAAVNTMGTLEGNSGYSAAAVLDAFNARLRTLAEANPRVRVIDYAGFVAQHGLTALVDDRMWHVGRMRLGRKGLEHLAALHARYLAALLLPRRKCLVLDLDNTLWGGVLGEDGPQGIALGQEGVGLAYREFQLAVRALAQRGIVLAVASKNNPADVMEVFENHPEMVLRRNDFACVEIHWRPKSESFPRIAQQLNLGMDSFVFWDDEPRERDIVRQQHPAVLVPEVPADPSGYARALLNLECFDVLTLTEEDRRRGAMYREEADRQQWLSAAPPSDLDAFYRSLNMRVSITRPDGYTMPRFAQLTQRTNQFNFTTRRYSENDLRAKLADPSFGLYTISLQDRFGDLGVIGAAIVHQRGQQWELDTFLMSCRALGRGAEDAFLVSLVEKAADAGASLHGSYIPTKKNVPAKEFLERLQIKLGADAGGEQRFTVDASQVQWPEWISMTTRSAAVES